MEDLHAHPVYDKALQQANIWLKDLMYELGISDPQAANRILRASLQALRDRLPATEAVHLGAQLPTLIRGIYYGGWKFTATPVKMKSREEFLAFVEEKAGAALQTDREDAVRAVFKLLRHKMDRGEIEDVESLMPADLKEFWPQPTRQRA